MIEAKNITHTFEPCPKLFSRVSLVELVDKEGMTYQFCSEVGRVKCGCQADKVTVAVYDNRIVGYYQCSGVRR